MIKIIIYNNIHIIIFYFFYFYYILFIILFYLFYLIYLFFFACSNFDASRVDIVDTRELRAAARKRQSNSSAW